MKKHILRILGFGLIVWIIPMIVSMGFYSPEGKLTGDLFLFKTVMILVGNTTGCFLLFRLAKLKPESPKTFFTYTGLIWFLQNIGLDLLILIPMSGMSVPAYFVQIGLRYLVMIIIGATVGYSIQAQRE
ncbi:hypothetical protein [Leptospira idonii]|uniref:Uncharacterized protein n=1 Tax=Leptospira idonii TaxID=1193500 RepID=A0A4R9LX76_9LEPT|nr:hypothetical protein [Leptospira idonii]TGN18860.1 hypothetical protein EHS15_10580 [Leptospira idonii]